MGGTLAFRRALALRRDGEARSGAARGGRGPTSRSLMTRKSSSSTSISSGWRTCPPPSRKPEQSPNCRTCRPSSCRRASTSSRCRRSRRPTNSSSRSPSESSPGVGGSIRPRISIKWGRRSWPCLTSIEDSCSFERRRISRARQAFEHARQIYPVGPMLDEVTGLQTYDRHAREVARRVRTIIAEQFPTKPVAA